jgi:hypothetical protein
MSGVTDLLDHWQIGGGELTDARLNTMVVNSVAPQFEAINQTLTQVLSHLSQVSPDNSMCRNSFQQCFSNQNTWKWYALLMSFPVIMNFQKQGHNMIVGLSGT